MVKFLHNFKQRYRKARIAGFFLIFTPRFPRLSRRFSNVVINALIAMEIYRSLYSLFRSSSIDCFSTKLTQIVHTILRSLYTFPKRPVRYKCSTGPSYGFSRWPSNAFTVSTSTLEIEIWNRSFISRPPRRVDVVFVGLASKCKATFPRAQRAENF